MEYVLNSLNAGSLTSSVQGLGDALSRAAGAVTTPLQRLIHERLPLPVMDPTTVVVLALVSVVVVLGIGYYALFTA
jgi:hypothetical protein